MGEDTKDYEEGYEDGTDEGSEYPYEFISGCRVRDGFPDG